jgi:hypothetical protein
MFVDIIMISGSVLIFMIYVLDEMLLVGIFFIDRCMCILLWSVPILVNDSPIYSLTIGLLYAFAIYA